LEPPKTPKTPKGFLRERFGVFGVFGGSRSVFRSSSCRRDAFVLVLVLVLVLGRSF